MTTACNKELATLGDMDEKEDAGVYMEQVNLYMNLLETNAHFAHLMNNCMAGYPLIVVFRLFKAFSAQPRLAVVTSTLVSASVDLMHFLLVFVSVFASFAVSGTVLFGKTMDDFATLPRAMNACFRMALGDFDWGDLSRNGRFEAGIYFWIFQILVVLVLLNMLLAIVMDAYTEVT